MFDITGIETDKEAEIVGVWRPYKDGSELLIARMQNKKYRSYLRSKIKANRAILDNEDDLSDEVSEKLVKEAMSKTILLGWKGIAMNGTEVQYSSEIALQLLDGSREFFDTVRGYADDSEAYRKKVEDAAVKS